MQFKSTTALKKILKLKKPLKVIQGGSSAGKTIGVLLIFIDKAQSRKNVLSSVVSETMPHIKRGAERDFLNIMKEHKYYKEDRWNRTDHIYTFETGSQIEFFSADQSDKVRGPRRNGDLFLNECNNVQHETYVQLDIRTAGDTYLDYNPTASFWIHDEIIGKDIEHDFLILTYLDNEGLSKEIVQKIESRKNNKYFWQVYGLGQLGEIEGKIYQNWRTIDSVPHEARLERFGIDFGYTNDPTAIVAIYYYNGGYILDEITYQKGLSNKQIADIILNQKKSLCVADSAEPKSIDEIRAHGVNIMPTLKGKDSVRQGIQMVQAQSISMTKASTNLIKEYRNYLWLRDKNGAFMRPPKPIGIWNHALDGVRYGMSSLIPVMQRREIMDNMPRLAFEGRNRKGNPAV